MGNSRDRNEFEVVCGEVPSEISEMLGKMAESQCLEKSEFIGILLVDYAGQVCAGNVKSEKYMN